MESKIKTMELKKQITELLKRWNDANDEKKTLRGLGRVYYGDDMPDKHVSVHVNKLITGKLKSFNMDRIPAICKYLNCSADELFGIATSFENQPENDPILDEMRSMKINQRKYFTYHSILRVPNGWVYHFDNDDDCTEHTSVFIPDLQK